MKPEDGSRASVDSRTGRTGRTTATANNGRKAGAKAEDEPACLNCGRTEFDEDGGHEK